MYVLLPYSLKCPKFCATCRLHHTLAASEKRVVIGIEHRPRRAEHLRPMVEQSCTGKASMPRNCHCMQRALNLILQHD